MNHNSIFIFSDDYITYRFHDHHPFNQQRLLLTLDLMKELHLIKDSQIVSPRLATDEELTKIHNSDYIDTVKRAGVGEKIQDLVLHNYGIGTEDTPVFPHMHEASSMIVGGTLVAAQKVMSGEVDHAMNIAGGLHHAFRGRASGFCVYNDISVTIDYLREIYDARVLYIDTDAHHGDGVQWAFYDDPNVLTVSLHETGKYLFPGTGKVTERGEDKGYGYSINVPLEPYTEDESFLECLHAILPTITKGFKPDIIISQNGCDAHSYDPLTHLSCSMRTYQEIPKLVHELAHQYCEGRWVAVGGGGYDIWRVVPRAWTMLWAEMSGQPLSNLSIPESWINRWKDKTDIPLPSTLLDDLTTWNPIPRRTEIEHQNRLTIKKALLHAPRG
ncbi:MAG: acetoin utilization protein AcuC [Bacilli bacterium]